MVRLSPTEVTSQEAIYLRQIFHTQNSSIINLSLRNARSRKGINNKNKNTITLLYENSIKINIKEIKK